MKTFSKSWIFCFVPVITEAGRDGGGRLDRADGRDRGPAARRLGRERRRLRPPVRREQGVQERLHQVREADADGPHAGRRAHTRPLLQQPLLRRVSTGKVAYDKLGWYLYRQVV